MLFIGFVHVPDGGYLSQANMAFSPRFKAGKNPAIRFTVSKSADTVF